MLIVARRRYRFRTVPFAHTAAARCVASRSSRRSRDQTAQAKKGLPSPRQRPRAAFRSTTKPTRREQAGTKAVERENSPRDPCRTRWCVARDCGSTCPSSCAGINSTVGRRSHQFAWTERLRSRRSLTPPTRPSAPAPPVAERLRSEPETGKLLWQAVRRPRRKLYRSSSGSGSINRWNSGLFGPNRLPFRMAWPWS